MNMNDVNIKLDAGYLAAEMSPEYRVAKAIEIIAAGGMVIVVDDELRENEGDLIASASTITPEMVAFMVNYTTGILCVSLSGERADALNLPPMTINNDDPNGTAYTVSCDAHACGTGVSAMDRTITFHALSQETPAPQSLRRPGHVFPLRAQMAGVLEREGHTEAAFDLVRLAGHEPVGVLSELVNLDGSMMCGAQLDKFAEIHGLTKVSIKDLVQWRKMRNDL